MNEKKIEPTAAMVRDVECWRSFTGTADRTPLRPILRAALNHYDAPGLFECDYTDYVHVDEAATRVEAAREQGWDDAAQHIYNKGWEGVTALRKANPHRPAPELPTEDGAVIIPADGHDYIEIRAGKKSRRLTWDADAFVWYDAYGTYLGTDITPGTWKVDDQ